MKKKVQLIGYGWHTSVAINPAVEACSAGHEYTSDDEEGIVHNVWAIDYCRLRGMRYRVRGVVHEWEEREPGRFHIYAPQTVYDEDLSGTSHRAMAAAVMFRGGAELGLTALTDQNHGFASVADPTNSIWRLLFQMAEVGQAQGEAGFAHAQSLLWQVAALLRNVESQGGCRFVYTPPRPISSDAALAEEVDVYLQTHLAQRITLEILSKHFHTSPSVISHCYKSIRGRSPIAALISFRVQTAQALLLTGAPLKAIAAETGFNDAFHLSHAFKQAFGMAPRTYLKRLRHHSDGDGGSLDDETTSSALTCQDLMHFQIRP